MMITESSSSESLSLSTPDELDHDPSSSSSVLGKKETRAVGRSKVLVYVALLIAAAAVGISTFFLLRKSEKDLFESEVSQVVYCRELSTRHSVTYPQ